MKTKTKSKSKMKADSVDAELGENIQKKPELKYQLTRSGNKVIELFNPNEDYSPRTWESSASIDDVIETIKEKKLFFPGEKCLLVYNSNNQIIAIGSAPPQDIDVFEELVFDSEEERSDFIKENSLKPALNICPPEIQDVVRKFFNGEVCFFPGFRTMHSEFFEKKSKIENDPVKTRSLFVEFEEKIIDILHNL